MPQEVTVKLCSIAEDGLPDASKDVTFSGQVAFIFNDAVISGWPVSENIYPEGVWETVFDDGLYHNVKYYLVFPENFFMQFDPDRIEQTRADA